MKVVQSQPSPKQKLGHSIFRWLIAAKRTLTVTELCTALSVHIGDTELDDLALPSNDMVIDVCGGFVTLDEASKNVRIAHATARDYLLKVDPKLDQQDDSLLTCLATYLTFQEFCTGPALSQEAFNKCREQNALLDYAAHHVRVHGLVGAPTTNVEKLILKLATTERLASSFLEAFYAPSETLTGYDWFPRESTPSHVAITIGFLEPVKALLEDRRYALDILSKNSKGQAPIHIAAIYGNYTISECLLKKNVDVADPDRYGYPPFLYAVSEGHVSLVELFQRNSRNRQELVTSTLNNGDTALHLAAAKDHHDIALFLLQSHAPIDAKNNKGLTPKDLAMQSSSIAMQNTFISWLDMTPGSQSQGIKSLYRPIWSGLQGMVEDIIRRPGERTSTPGTPSKITL